MKLTAAELEAAARALADYVANATGPTDAAESALCKINNARPSNLSKRLNGAIRSTTVAEEN